MHLAPLIRDLAIILAVAGVATLIFQRIKQPVVLGYLAAGLIIGPHTPPFPLITDIPNIKILAELGVIFLMFFLGLEFSFRKLVRVGATAGVTACFEVIVMLGLGFVTGRALGYSTMDSVFLGATLSISSTTIIIKALDELGLKTRRFAELIFAVLIVEDLAAILILVSLTTFATAGSFSAMTLARSLAKLTLVVGSWVLAGYFAVPRFVKYVGKEGNDEMLTVVAVGLCLCLVVFAAYFDYSVALGAFIMGSILAESTESHRIQELIKPLRDLFAAIFFVSVGMLIDPAAILRNWPAILIITAITIVGKLGSSAVGTLLTGQTLKSSILVGCGLAQIGEFSFIIAGVGLSLGVMSEVLYPIVVAVSLVTTFTTPYFIRYSDRLASGFERSLPLGIRRGLSRYQRWFELQAGQKKPDPGLNKALLRWAINGFLVTVIWVLTAEYSPPVFTRWLNDKALAITMSWAAAIILSAPFLWAMLSVLLIDALKRRKTAASHPGVTLAMQVTTLFWFGVMSLSYFPAKYVGIVTAFFGAFLFTSLYRQLESSYHWLEENLTQVFKESPKSSKDKDMFYELAPWDEHLVRLKVNADSEIAGETLQRVALRTKYGVNVVAIQRGSKSVVAPLAAHQIFPKDELLVLGTDEQIDRVRPVIEKSGSLPNIEDMIAGYELRRLFVHDGSHLLGRSIRQSELKERFGCMVVGIERRGRRIMNPQSDMVIEIEDGLLVVGASKNLDALFSEFEKEKNSAVTDQ